MSPPRTAAREATFVSPSVPTQEQTTGGNPLHKRDKTPFSAGPYQLSTYLVDMGCRWLLSALFNPQALSMSRGRCRYCCCCQCLLERGFLPNPVHQACGQVNQQDTLVDFANSVVDVTGCRHRSCSCSCSNSDVAVAIAVCCCRRSVSERL
jgi:hypothetical protein